tara:strand:+ start:7814 stop:9517 length:1704 start_codon:yes stop_codon:yes gene_type:complete
VVATINIISNSGYGEEVNAGEIIEQGVAGGAIERYKIFYEDNGKTTIRPVDSLGNLLLNRSPIYTDGKWDTSQISGSNIGGANNPSWLSPKEQERIHASVQKGVKKHVSATGGIEPSWVSQDGFTDDIPSSSAYDQDVQTNSISENPNEAESSMYSDTEASNQSDTAQGLSANDVQAAYQAELAARTSGGQSALEEQAAFMENEEDIMFKKIVKYPMDMSNTMDHMYFQCYTYQAPYAATMRGSYGEGLWSDGAERSSGLAFGASRMSPYKKKLGAGIKLPMPNNMSDSNARKWTEGDMNTAAMGAVQSSSKKVVSSFFDVFGIGNFMRKTSQQMERLSQTTGRASIITNQISQLAADMGYDVPPEAIMQRSVGVIANANTELLFSGVSLRAFEFQWLMSPRNRLEAHNVRMILRAFKQWSAPRKLKKIGSGEGGGINNNQTGEAAGVGQAGGPSYFLGTPNIFRLRYVTDNNKDILGVNKFKPCALTQCDINYTPEGQWMAYEGGMPVSVSMTLRFNELEPVYNTDYSPRVAAGRQHNPASDNDLGDLMPISIIKQYDERSSDVGY